MSYSTESDLQELVGEATLVKWSNPDGAATTVNSARVTTAITEADAQIDQLFRGSKYVIPFVTSDDGDLATLRRWSTGLASTILATPRRILAGADGGKKAEKQGQNTLEQQVRAEMRSVIAGIRQLNASLVSTSVPSAPVVIK